MTNNIEMQVEVWKKIVDVQMHFNEIEMKIRNFAILILSAFVGVAGLSLKEGIHIADTRVPIASLIFLLCVGICWIFYFVDRAWYHPLLKAAVEQGQAAERGLSKHLPDIGLAQAIQDKSPYRMFGKELRSTQKIQVLYGTLATSFILLAIVTAIVPLKGSAPVPSATTAPATPP